MKKASIGFIVLSIAALLLPQPAQAVEEEFTVTVLKGTSCDQRAPRVKVEIGEGASRVGYGYPDSDVIFWLDSHGVTPGVHRYSLPEQPFGSTAGWVMVAAFEGSQGLYTAPLLSFNRPARKDCVVKQNLRIESYAPGVNQVCPEGTQKLFMLKTFVTQGSPGYFAANGNAEIVFRSDRQLNADGYVVPPRYRENDFYFYPPNRGAKVKKTGLENSVNLVLSSKNVEVELGELSADCTEEFEGEG
jgi:hypothetical protein